MAAAVAVLILLASLGLCLLPLLLTGGEEADREELDRRTLLQRERERILDEIHEVDLDLAMGKVTDKDHGALRARLEEQAMITIAALRELDGEEPAAVAGSPAGEEPAAVAGSPAGEEPAAVAGSPAREEPSEPAGEESEGRT